MSLLERHHLSKLVAPVHDHVNLAPLEKNGIWWKPYLDVVVELWMYNFIYQNLNPGIHFYVHMSALQ